jgi:hypothetical protein
MSRRSAAENPGQQAIDGQLFVSKYVGSELSNEIESESLQIHSACLVAANKSV